MEGNIFMVLHKHKQRELRVGPLRVYTYRRPHSARRRTCSLWSDQTSQTQRFTD